MAKHQITVTVNGAAHAAEVDSRLLLVHLIRDELRLTGTHIGCDTTHCGACTVLLDGKPTKSCTVLAVQADGEYLGETPLTLSVAPRALDVLIAPGPSPLLGE